MKSGDIIKLIVALIIFIVAAYMIYTLLNPQKANGSAKGATITVVTAINPTFDSSSLQTLNDPTQTKDFYSPPDLKSGLNNPQPFGSAQ